MFKVRRQGRRIKELVPIEKERLRAAQFGKLADVPPELEWLANITNEKLDVRIKSA